MGIVFCFQPRLTSHAQGEGTKETIKKAVDSIKVQSALKAVDSVNYVADSLANLNSLTVSKLENGANDLPVLTRELKSNVDKLIHKQPDTIAVVKTQTLWKTVPKTDYWERQRKYTDSLAKAKKDSIRWQNRGILRKIFGTGKKYMK